MKFQRMVIVIFMAGLFALPPLASAHHSVNSEFDVNKNVAVTGVLTKVDLVNPHAYMYFDVKDATGKVQQWSFETGAPAALKRAGTSVRDTLIPGQSFKVVYSPAKDGHRLGLVHSIVTPDGRFFAFGATNNVDAARELSK